MRAKLTKKTVFVYKTTSNQNFVDIFQLGNETGLPQGTSLVLTGM